MGLFGSSAPSTIPAPKTSSDGTPIAPDRSARQKCWDARDTYFACLDRHGIVDSIRNKEEAEKACPKEGEQLAGNCASSWVRYNPYTAGRWIEIRGKTEREQLEGVEEMDRGA